MPEQNQNPFAPFFDEVRKIVREEIAAAMANSHKPAADKEWLNAEELAELYGMPKTWFEERGRAGDIARTKPGRYVLFKRRDVEEFLEKNKSS
jgi:excisionase family DNA binding protein